MQKRFDFMQNSIKPKLKFSCCVAETPSGLLNRDGWAPADCHPDCWVLECFNGHGIHFRAGGKQEQEWLPDHWNLYPPGMKYAVRFCNPEKRYENLWLTFPAEPALPRHRALTFCDPEKALFQKVRELHFMRLAGELAPADLINLKLQVILTELEISFQRSRENEIIDFIQWDNAAQGNDTLLDRTDWLLRKHLRCPPSVPELAEMLGMSVSGFSHRLKAESNWTPVDRIRYIRMEHAKKLLKQSASRDAIRNTAWRLGFRSRQYFCTVFKQETGMTPGEFLRSGQ